MAVTMPTNPKSLGWRRRARIMRETMRKRKLAPWAKSRIEAPRIVFSLRSCIVVKRLPLKLPRSLGVSNECAVSCLFAADETLVGPHVAPVAIASAVRDTQVVEVSVDFL